MTVNHCKAFRQPFLLDCQVLALLERFEIISTNGVDIRCWRPTLKYILHTVFSEIVSQETAISTFSRSFNIFNNNNFVNVDIWKIKVKKRNVNKMSNEQTTCSQKQQTVAHLAVEEKPAASLLLCLNCLCLALALSFLYLEFYICIPTKWLSPPLMCLTSFTNCYSVWRGSKI